MTELSYIYTNLILIIENSSDEESPPIQQNRVVAQMPNQVASTSTPPIEPNAVITVSESSSSSTINSDVIDLSDESDGTSAPATSPSTCNHPCPICLNNVTGRKPNCIPCGHIYCFECINKCQQRDIYQCVLCKEFFKSTDLREIFM